MRLPEFRFAGLAVSALLVVACVASTSPTDPPPTQPAATQEAIVGAVSRWIAANKRGALTPVTYVLDDLSNPSGSFYPEGVPELHDAEVPPWGDTLTDGSRSAIEATLGAVVDLEFVTEWETVVDPNAIEHLGCRPYLGDRTMIEWGAPVRVRDAFFVQVNLDEGCQGEVYLLQVELANSQFEVSRVVREGSWIV